MPLPRRRLRLTVAVLAAFALPALAVASPRPLSQSIRERWTYRDGLPHNVVHRLLAARSGYLWIGSQEGLVRFDGVRFTVFTRQETEGLVGNEISALQEDDAGVVWIGTSRGLSRLEEDAFQAIDLGGEAAVTDLAADGEGGVWAATEAHGVLHVRAGRPWRVERLEGLPPQRVLALARAGETLWIGGYGGLARLQGGSVERLGGTAETAPVVTRLLAARDGTLWVGTTTGLARLAPGATGLERTTLAGGALVGALLEDREGALWVGTEGAPLLRVVGGRPEPMRGAGSPASSMALAEDADGDLWAGTESGGLFHVRWGQVLTIATEEGLAADSVYAVHGGRGGATWVASGGGLDRIVGDQPRRIHAGALAGESLGGLLEDRAGDLWVGTGRGVVRFRPRGPVRYGPEQGLTGQLARAIHEDAGGALWVGTSNGVFRLAGDRFQGMTSDPGLTGDKINVLVEHPGGGLWAGTTTGLARVAQDRLVPATSGGRPIRGDVTALLADPDGALWIGMVGEGLGRLQGDRLQRWTRRDGLHEDTVLAILDDRAGHLWLAGTHGIARVDRAELEEVAAGRRGAVVPLVLGAADGMRDRECNGGVAPSAWRAVDGRLWFATIRGVVVIDPARLEVPRGPPQVRVEELLVDGRRWSPAAPGRLAPGPRRIELRYTGLALAAADRIRFRHRLLGLDEAFVEAGSERVAQFTNLGPGRYVFEVQAASAAGEWGRPAEVGFEIAPHFWQSPWFAAAAALAALGLAGGAHLARTRALRRSEALLAARVEEEMRKVKVLEGLLPTCSWCNKIRDEGGTWRRFEDYLSSHADVHFTHGMCPECFHRTGGDGAPP